jgi:DNA polymerase-3 subunit beta
MKVVCTQENLAKALNIVSRTVTARATLPVLSNILLSVSDGRLKLTSTDLEIGVSTWIGGQVEDDGALTVPARLFSDFVVNNRDLKIELLSKDNTIHLKSDHFEANINGIEASEFPMIPEVSGQPLLKISSKKFVEAVKQVVIAPAADESRPVLAGVLFSFKDSLMKLVATDSYRLAEKKIELERTVQPVDIIVPSRSLNEVLRIIGSLAVEEIEISINENQVLFTVGDTQIVSRLIEGIFPNYEQIIPTTEQTTALVDVSEITGIVKMAALFAKESANNIKLDFSEKQLVAKSMSAQVGDNISQMSAEITGRGVEIAFNSKYILDFLSVVGEKNIKISVNDRLSPGVFRPGKSRDYLYIIMPLRVEE